jgi:hypothetical protein
MLISFQDFYERHYVPENMSVVAIGKLDHSKVVEAVRSRFGHLHHSTHSKAEIKLFYPGVSRQHLKDCEFVGFGIGFKNCGVVDANFVQLLMLAQLFRADLVTPLGQRLNAEKLVGKNDVVISGLEPTVYNFFNSIFDFHLFRLVDMDCCLCKLAYETSPPKSKFKMFCA